MSTASAGEHRLAVLVSGGGRTMLNLHASCRPGGLLHAISAQVALVISSRACIGADRARETGLPLLTLPGVIPAADLADVLHQHRCGWIVLAGYLKKLVIPPGFEGRAVNIHPALLPRHAGRGMHGEHVHRAVLAAGEPESGCTVHLCDAEYDTGAVILRRRCPVLPGDTPEVLAARVFEQETVAYPKALHALLTGAWRPGDPPIEE